MVLNLFNIFHTKNICMEIFSTLSKIFIFSGIITSIIIYVDARYERPQMMKIMEPVWALTALWASWIGIIAYFKFGRSKKKRRSTSPTSKSDVSNLPNIDISGMDMPGMAHELNLEKKNVRGTNMSDMDMGSMDMSGMGMGRRAKWQSVTLSTLHCGAGCTLADIIGETFTYYVPLSIMNSPIAAQWVLDYALALVIGVYFQYSAIHSMSNLSKGGTILKAAKIDFFSLSAWQLGMYGAIAVAMWGIYGGELPAKTTFDFWFIMQIAMLCGFITAYPVNVILIKMGIKKAM